MYPNPQIREVVDPELITDPNPNLKCETCLGTVYGKLVNTFKIKLVLPQLSWFYFQVIISILFRHPPPGPFSYYLLSISLILILNISTDMSSLPHVIKDRPQVMNGFRHKMADIHMEEALTVWHCLSLDRRPECEGVEEEGGGGAGAGVEVNISIGIFTGVFRHTALGRLNTGESCIITI